MNFFEHQDRARRKTGMLVWLFVVAVAGLIAGTYILIMSLYLGGLEQAEQQREALSGDMDLMFEQLDSDMEDMRAALREAEVNPPKSN